MQLAPGTRLGAYEIVGLIGAGGMGEVYRARDSRLERRVAIKVLPEDFRANPERAARFEREAKLLAALNHSHIATIHGFEQANGEQFIVMELVEGETLAERIARGRIPLHEALPIARQIAEALEVAHEQNVIHRDLKPANIKLRPDATVKVLDFGLAKALEPAATLASPATLTKSPTLTSPVGFTGPGVLLGTAAYMSPEQARGQVVDKRADVWAFGCVFYEMLTGRRAFEAASIADTLAAIVGGDVEWAALPAGTPESMRRLLRRCLAKERRQRLSDGAAVRFAIEDALSAPAAEPLAPPDRTAPRWRVVAALAIVSALMLGSLRFVDRGTTPLTPHRLTRLSIVPNANTPLRLTTGRALTISADGTRVVYVSSPGTLVVRALDQLEPRTITGVGTAPYFPFFSPDGQWIAFFDGNTLKKVATAGGPVQTVAQMGAVATGGTWGPNDVIVFSVAGEEQTGLRQVSAEGGVPKVLTTPDRAAGESYHNWPEMLPGGQAVLFHIASADNGGFFGTAVLDLRTLRWRALLPYRRPAHYVAPGYLIYCFAGTLFAARFDLTRLEVTSAEVPVGIDHVMDLPVGANLSIARDGTLIYVAEPPPLTLTWVDRQNRREPLGAPPGRYWGVRLSPDATRAVLATSGPPDLLLWDLGRRNLTRLTADGLLDTNPTWTPDGTRLVWTSGRASIGGLDLVTQSADGTGPVGQLTHQKGGQLALDITPDGKQILVGLNGPRTGADLALLPLNSTGDFATLLATPFDERQGKVSPDGRWLAYSSNESGPVEVFVRPFPDVDSAKWQVSTGGGSQPLWARSGRELFYRAPDGSVVGVSVQPEGRQLHPGTTPTTLVGGSSFLNETSETMPQQTYDVMPDGSRFLMIQEGSWSSTTSGPVIVVVQNLLEELKARLPPN